MAMTESDRSTIVGVFEDPAKAEQAVSELRSAGFSDDQISLLVRSAGLESEDITSDEKEAEAGEVSAVEEMIPSAFKSKTEVSRTLVTVKAEGREQEALGILHRNGANNANIPDALKSDLEPILGSETEGTRTSEPGPGDRSKGSFFEATPAAPGMPREPGAP